MTESLVNALRDAPCTVLNEHVRMSPKIDQLAAALCLAQAEIKPAPFNRTNPHFKSQYADLASQIETSKVPLKNNGLSLVQVASGKPPLVTVTTILMHKSGQWICGDLTLSAQSNTPQHMGAAITYARRYGRGAVLDMASEEDDDGNAASSPVNTGHSQPPKKYSEPRYDITPPTQHVTDPKDFVFPFGKFKGKRLADVAETDIKSYMNYLRDQAHKDGKPLSPNAEMFCKAAESYLANLPSAKPVQDSFPDDFGPPPTDFDIPPF